MNWRLDTNAERFGLAGRYRNLPLTPELVAGARSYWCRPRRAWPSWPRYVELVAEHAAAEVKVSSAAGSST